MDYIDFIDAPAVRDHLRTLPPLPPAQRCILIAQSDIRPLTDKLAALREIRDATPPEDFSRGCWTFQCDDPFPVILDRYLRTRAERLVTFRKAEPGVVYVVESGYRNGSALFSTFDAALASVKELEDDESPPVIRRRRIDDTDGATLVAELSRKLEIAEIDVEGGPNAGNMRIWGGDLPNGYAHVPHPFKRGDIVRQGDAYFVLDGRSDEGGRFSWGTDEDDMQLYGMSWDAFLANWDGKMSSDDLLAALRDGTRPVNDTVYTAIMSPVGQHPSKCRIGVCSGTPILESGWILHSSLITENAERIYAEIIELLNSLRKQNYDAENDAWMVPINALDKWMTSCEKRLRMRTSQQTTIIQNGGNNDQE